MSQFASLRTSHQLGSALARLREQANLTQAELGQKAGLRQATISKIESGSESSRLETLCRILAALEHEMQIGPRRQSAEADLEDLF
ncbi:helix-turn-helix domain-containing protein [Parvularcula oceani]|uniref:helix-turn-helix domain-containing protein n=1 Tax=Parvularcula oceani TaxID=1247963 RepID=UPI0004E18BD2|nr:helix-turn-helix domain-containing protein [Parvularcula oceani]